MNLNFIGKIYILHHLACVLILAVDHTCSLFQKRILERVKSNNRPLRLTGDGRCGSWSNRPTAKSPPSISPPYLSKSSQPLKNKYYYYYYEIDGGDFAMGQFNLHSNVWLDRPLCKALHLFFDRYANTANSFLCYHTGYRDWKFLKDRSRRISKMHGVPSRWWLSYWGIGHWPTCANPKWLNELGSWITNNSYKPITNMVWVRVWLCKIPKREHSTHNPWSVVLSGFFHH